MIAIIDYDAGNIKSVEKALAYLGEEVRITRDREEILTSDGVILPESGHLVMLWKSYILTDWEMLSGKWSGDKFLFWESVWDCS